MSSHSLVRIALAIVVAHALVNVVHGAAHSAMRIDMTFWQNVFIALVILVLPIAAAVMIWRSGRGYAWLGLSMLGALLFGVYYHFVAAGADNVASVGAHAMGARFRVTAVLLALSEAAGVIVGFIGMRRPA